MILVGCLLVVTVVLGGVVQVTENTVDSLESRLGFYFYLDDSIDDEVGSSALLQLTQELEQIGLEAVYYSKDQAYERLARSLPDVMEQLEAYEIGNPLPATLYVPFGSRESYELLRTVVIEYEDFITNSGELDSQIVFGAQEERVQSVIAVAQTTQSLVTGLLVSLLLIMGAFIAYGNRIHLMQFAEQLRLERLLGASWIQRVLPFFCWTRAVCLGASVLGGVMIGVSRHRIQGLLAESSDALFEGVLTTVSFAPVVSWSIVLVFVIGTLVTTGMTWRR